MNKPIYLVHADEYKNWIFDPNHPTQGRRFTNAYDLLISTAKAQEIEIVVVLPRLATKSELERVHSPTYIKQVLDEHTCDEWDGRVLICLTLPHSLLVGPSQLSKPF